VSSRGLKPILGLIVLLAGPCLGLGGRAEASFALARSALAPERPPVSLGLEFQLVLNGEEPVEPEAPCSSTSATSEPAPVAPGESPRPPARYHHILPVPTGLSNGTSSAGSPPSGPGSGTGLIFILPSDCAMPGGGESGRLFLADERLNPPPFPSRLFRPPRSN